MREQKAPNRSGARKLSHSPFDTGLDKGAANYTALSPLGFLKRSALVFPDKTAIIYGDRRHSYAEFHARSRRLASALSQRGIGAGDTVAGIVDRERGRSPARGRRGRFHVAKRPRAWGDRRFR